MGNIVYMELRREIDELMRACQNLLEAIQHNNEALSIDELGTVLYQLQSCQIALALSRNPTPQRQPTTSSDLEDPHLLLQRVA